MPATTSFFVDPYFDNYDPSKNFFRILYRPGVSVQARELTQVQSILQNQIEEHGRLTVNNGSPVTGGEIIIDKGLTAVTIGTITNALSTGNVTITPESLIGKIITNGTVRAIVVDGDSSQSSNILLVNYIGNGEFDFSSGDIDITQEDDSLVTAQISTSSPALHATISEGVFFIHGFFISTSEQKIIISRTTNKPSSEIIIGYTVTESIITSDSDISLLDPAQGSFNENAPGANRFFIGLAISSITPDSSLLAHDRNSNLNFVELFRVDTNGDGIIDSYIKSNSGDNYILEDFSADISGNTNSISLNISGGKASINGELIEKLDKEVLSVTNTKMVTQETSSQLISQRYGNYLKANILVLDSASLIETNETQVFSLFTSVAIQDVNNQIGTCNVRQLKTKSSNSIDVYISNLTFSDPLNSNITTLTRGNNQINVILETPLSTNITGSVYRFGTLEIIDEDNESEFFNIENHVNSSSTNHTFTLNKTPRKSTYSSLKIHWNINMLDVLIANSGDVALQIANDGLTAEGTTLFESGSNSLYQRIPKEGTSAVSQVDFVLTTVSELASSGNLITLTAPDISVFLENDGRLSLEQMQKNFFILDRINSNVVDLSRSDISIELTNNSKTALITIPTGSYHIHFDHKYPDETIDRRSKTFLEGNVTTYTNSPLEQGHIEIPNSSANKVQGESDSLTGFFDIQSLVGVIEVPEEDSFTSQIIVDSLANPTTDVRNVTDRYILDNGQRDDKYEEGRIILKGNSPSPTGKLLIIVNFFTHGTGVYFTKSSYPGTISDELLPNYISEKTGDSISVGDIIDFRRTTDDTPSSFVSSKENMGVKFISYLPRRDKVVLDKQGTTKIIQGVPAENPKYPTTGSEDLVLFLLDIPGYLYNLSDIKLTKVDYNTNYKMKQLEELVSSLGTESLVQNINISNNNGENRTKTSVLVDSFDRNHSVGDVQNNDYNCSIDSGEKVLRPPFSSDAWKFDIESNSNTVRTGDLATLSYTSSIFIDQPFSSGTTSLNPSNKSIFNGQLILGTSSDIWYDNSGTVRPFVCNNINGKNNGWKQLQSDKVFNSQYNDWSTNWSGVELLGEYNSEDISRGIESGVYDKGLLPENTVDIDKSVIPYVRSQDIVFVAKGLRSGTLHNITIDGGSALTPIAGRFGVRCTLLSSTGTFIAKDGEFEDILNSTSSVVGQVVSVSSNTLLIVPAAGATLSGTITGSRSGATAVIGNAADTTLTSDSFGEVAGVFTIPQGSLLSGNMVVRVADNTVSNSTSVAENTFYAKGLLNTNISTRELGKTRKDLQSIRLGQKTNSSNILNSLSQIFNISSSENPNGIFLQNLHLFFSSIDTSTNFGSHVSVELRPVVNGVVSDSEVIPYSKVSLHSTVLTVVPSGTTITIPTAEGSNPNSTIFEFNAPVYLSPGEYAIVIKANSNDFSVHLADVGGTMIGSTETINKASHIKQLTLPYTIGNSENQKMLMFRLNRCEFNSSGSLVQVSQTSSLSGATSFSPDTVKLVGQELNISSSALSHTFISNLDTLDTNIETNINYDFTSPRSINSTNRFRVTSSLSTTDSKVSPVIDLSRFGLYTVSNLVDNAGLKNTNFSVITGGTVGTRVFQVQTAELDTGSGASVSPVQDSSGNLLGLSISQSGSGYFLSPNIIVRADSSTSAAIVTDRVVRAIGEDRSVGGNVNGKYITKRITIEDEFPSTDLRVFINAKLPAETDISVYYKVLSSEDSGLFDDKEYYLMSEKKKQILDSNGNVRLIFGSENDTIIYESDGQLYNNFSHYAIKIIMTSSSTSYVPKIKDIAAISVR